MRWSRRALPILLAAALPVACQSGDDRGAQPLRTPLERPTGSISLVVGLVGTMSGPDAWRGEDAFEGADLAIHHLNAGLDEGARPFELVTLDDRGDPGRSLALVQDVASLDSTVGVLHAGPEEVLPQAEELLARRGIAAVLLYGDLYSARRLTEHVFQVSPPVLWQSRRLAAYIRRDRGYERAGAVVETTFAGRTAARSLRQALRAAGARPPPIAGYEPGEEASLRAALRRMRGRRVEALVFQGRPGSFGDLMDELRAMGAAYRGTKAARIASHPRARRRRALLRSRHWRPQVMGFDLALSPRVDAPLPPGTIAAAPYTRGVHYLPVPSFVRFRGTFREWWDTAGPPLGWEQRAYDGARMIGWAARRAGPEEDIARVLEGLRSRRFAGVDVTLGPDDHTAVDQASVGLWVVPRPGIRVRERNRIPDALPWVPLARGFSIDGQTLDIAAEDWRYLVRNPPRRSGPAPGFRRLRFGVTTGRTDPIH